VTSKLLIWFCPHCHKMNRWQAVLLDGDLVPCEACSEQVRIEAADYDRSTARAVAV